MDNTNPAYSEWIYRFSFACRTAPNTDYYVWIKLFGQWRREDMPMTDQLLPFSGQYALYGAAVSDAVHSPADVGTLPSEIRVCLGGEDPSRGTCVEAGSNGGGPPAALSSLTINRAGSGSGTVVSTPAGIVCGGACSTTFMTTTSVQLVATADPGSSFGGWSEDCSGTASTISLLLTGNKRCVATFESTAPTTATLTVVKAGTGAGTVTSSPMGINCGATCAASFSLNATVALSAAAASGSTFSGWSGNCSGTGQATVTMGGARSCTATFTTAGPGPAVPQCTLSASPNSVAPGGTVTLSASCSPAATSYAWTNTAFATNASSGTVNPTATTPYSVRGSNAGGAGNTASVTVTVTAPPSSGNFTGLWWNESQAGWGINFNHQGNILFGTLFSYDDSGAPLWLVMSAGTHRGDNCFQGTLYQTTGPAFNAVPFRPIGASNLADMGTMSVCFSGDSASLQYSVRCTNGAPGCVRNVSTSIRKQVFGSAAAQCESTSASRVFLTNYQDLWWNAAESGWGLNITQQGNTVFATLFTYRLDGQPIWYVMSGGSRRRDGSFSGDLYQTSGPPFYSNPFTPIGPQNLRRVGSMTLRFSDGNNALLSYFVDGVNVTKSITRQVFSAPLPSCSSPTPAPTISPVAGAWNGDAARAPSANFGGAPYCNYVVRMDSVSMSAVVDDAGNVTDGTAVGRMVETTQGGCTIAPAPAQNQIWRFAGGSTSGRTITLNLVGISSNAPRSDASFLGTVISNRLNGTLTIRRTDQAGNLAWVLQAVIQ